jgi:hypothetical protein
MMATRIDEVVRIPFSDLISHDVEWLNDYVSEQITGSRVALEDIGYKAESVDGDQIVLRVNGEVNEAGEE